ncbi:terminase TerL endonuclease subunit, partial [Acinetobacter baumannii]|uniref:terminase TerL endonuclease subunit n=2 Tax=Bacteria TaxID=2 RepID=UPI000A7C6C02
EDNDNLPFREWEEEGLLTIIPGDYVKHEYVFDWFVAQSQHFPIDLITYDPANAFRLVKDLETYGFQTEKVRQGALTLSPALKDIKELLLDGKVVY